MLKFLDIFKHNGVSCYTDSNVLVVSEELLDVCKHLDVVKALQKEHVTDIISGLSIFMNKHFKDMFNHLKQNAEWTISKFSGLCPLMLPQWNRSWLS